MAFIFEAISMSHFGIRLAVFRCYFKFEIVVPIRWAAAAAAVATFP